MHDQKVNQDSGTPNHDDLTTYWITVPFYHLPGKVPVTLTGVALGLEAVVTGTLVNRGLLLERA
jgi:hypothetical protein